MRNLYRMISASLLLLGSLGISTPSYATEVWIEGGTSTTFHSNKDHDTKMTGGYAGISHLMVDVESLKFGIKESIWYFPKYDGVVIGVGPFGEWHRRVNDSWTFLTNLSGTVGATNLDGKVPEIGGVFQCSAQIGLGVMYQDRVRVELRYQHISNGGTATHNAGLDMFGPVVSWRW